MGDITLTSDITVRLIDKMGGDHSVVAAAKVSTRGEYSLTFAHPSYSAGNEGLINYLMKMRHGTPFEHSSLTFYIHAPAFVWWEWIRHRIAFSYNLESSRYKVLEPVFWLPRHDRKVCVTAGHNPARPTFEAAPPVLMDSLRTNLEEAYTFAYEAYMGLIEDGIASEVARACLPFAVYFSGWVTTNPRALMSFLSLRTHDPEAKFVSYPQSEIEEAARACESVLDEGWPITYAAFVQHGRVAP